MIIRKTPNDISKYIDESIKELSSNNDEILIELTLKKLSTEFNVDYNIIKRKYETLKQDSDNIKQRKNIETDNFLCLYKL